MLHDLLGNVMVEPDFLHGVRHTQKPRVPFRRPDFDMTVHLAHIRMSVLLGVKFRPSEKPDEEVKLLDARMSGARTTEVQYVQYFTLRLVFDDVIERLDEITKNGR